MSIINRIARLLTADLHSLLDSLEEPAVMLKQSVREMEGIIEQGETAIRHLTRQHEELAQRLARLDQQLAATTEQIDFCFNERNDALARSQIASKLEYEQQRDQLFEQRQRITKRLEQQRGEVAEQREQLQAILDKLELLDATTQAECREGARVQPGSVGGRVSEEMVELAFLREKQRRAAGGE